MNVIFCKKSELKEVTILAIKELGGIDTTQQINLKVTEILKLSEEVLLLEDESGIGTMYEYRMSWIRTELKEKTLNPKRGMWILSDSR